MTAEQAIEYASAQQERFVEDLKELLRIPSISTLPEHAEDMQRAAAWVCDRIGQAGVSAEVIPAKGAPLVYGERLNRPNAPTVLVYGHYDVQPADPLELWQTPPFEPDVRNGNVYARGASDDKGQMLVSILAAESLMEASGELPVNLKLILEGQEESGGEAIERYVAEEGHRLTADFVQISDSHMFAEDLPTLESGLRGNVYTEIHVVGASHDLHSGLYGGVAPNPLHALAQIISGLRGGDGRILIPGFYDDVAMPADEIRRGWQSLPFDETHFREGEVGSHVLIGEPGFSTLERVWARPTLDVHGIRGGFVGEGGKTVIPAEATAKVSMRIVPNQRVDRIFQLFEEAVRELAPGEVEVEVRLLHGGNPVLMPTETPYMKTAAQALEETFGRKTVFVRSGGSIPIVSVFKEKLGLDSVMMGWGLPDDNLHAPNEKMSLKNFAKGIEGTIRFWELLGQA